MTTKFDKTDPVHNALREGLGQLIQRYFAGMLSAEAAHDTDKPRHRTAKRVVKRARKLSAAGRAAISRAQKVRWAKIHKAKAARASRTSK